MRLVINSGSVFKGGAEQVALSFMHECRNYNQHEFHVIVPPSLASQISQDDFPDNFTFHWIEKRPASSLMYFIKMLAWYRKFEKRIKPDCVISTGGHGYWKPKTAPVVGGFNIPHYIYPESPYFERITARKKLYWSLMRKMHLFFYRKLDAVLVQTDDVNERLRSLLPRGRKVYTVSNTVNTYFFNNESFNPRLPPKTENEIRLLTISSYYSHKNIEIIKDVAKELSIRGYSNFQFVLTLPQMIFQQKFGDNENGIISNVGPIPIKECPSLYQECDYMFLPTLLECFSASYAEAMVMKKPIITSDLSFAHTVCKDAAIYFKPLDPSDIADKIIEISMDTENQKKITKRGIEIVSSLNTAQQRAQKFIEICERTIEEAN